MNITVAQIIMEEARFAHIGDFLAQPPTPISANHNVGLSVELVRGQEPQMVAVRLRAKSVAPETQYSFSVSYLVLVQMVGERTPTQDELNSVGMFGARVLMPFVREVIGNMTSRGRFGASWINAVNFALPAEMATAVAPETGAARTPRKRKAKPKK